MSTLKTLPSLSLTPPLGLGERKKKKEKKNIRWLIQLE
jgi:hypothetical protein